MKRLTALLAATLICAGVFAQNRGDLISYQQAFDWSISETEDEVNARIPISLPSWIVNLLVYVDYPVKGYQVSYYTEDAQGNQTTATGLVVIPQNYGCNLPLAAYCHGTVFDRYDVPSYLSGAGDGAEFIIGLALAGAGYMTVMPDYVGLGDGPGFHPYVEANSEAAATIDILRAGRQLASQISVGLNGQVFLTGYSQGGHAAMAAHKDIAANYSSEFQVQYAGPGSGPYDLSGTEFDFLFNDPFYANPEFALYVLATCETVYGNVYNQPTDILVPPYDSLYTADILGQTGMTSWIPANWPTALQPTFYADVQNNPNHPLRQCLAASDVFNWKNKIATDMFYCTNDEQVDYQNSIKTRDVMRGKFKWYEFWYKWQIDAVYQGPFDHFTCVFPALLSTRGEFNDRRAWCFNKMPVGENPTLTAEKVGIEVPNIWQQTLEIDLTAAQQPIVAAALYDFEGMQIQSWSQSELRSGLLSVSRDGKPLGIYALEFQLQDGTTVYAMMNLQDHEVAQPVGSYYPIQPYQWDLETALDLSLLEEQVTGIQLLNAQGKIVRAYTPDIDLQQLLIKRGDLPSGTYEVKVETPTETYFLETILTDKALPANGLLALSPNPMQTLSVLDLSTIEEPVHGIRIISLDGRLIRQFDPKTWNNGKLQIHREDLASGIYLLSVQVGNRILTEKLIVQ
ncbi:T9SS type A sorting domain-containing protein [Pontibacter sp. G13]|uniref:T9SS type A sorting domain-containing protein n=1 Tax=Pontibacter sp. G13 TaxID=3074898 RepID=UPI00288A05A1|nr:T9SS type A sorting domain-containing protein [Pontibacter sp. G13]WNJ16791.1 T9SS type A sorting domain-containing protein [Pontibacter sp. G13]